MSDGVEEQEREEGTNDELRDDTERARDTEEDGVEAVMRRPLASGSGPARRRAAEVQGGVLLVGEAVVGEQDT